LVAIGFFFISETTSIAFRANLFKYAGRKLHENLKQKLPSNSNTKEDSKNCFLTLFSPPILATGALTYQIRCRMRTIKGLFPCMFDSN